MKKSRESSIDMVVYGDIFQNNQIAPFLCAISIFRTGMGLPKTAIIFCREKISKCLTGEIYGKAMAEFTKTLEASCYEKFLKAS